MGNLLDIQKEIAEERIELLLVNISADARWNLSPYVSVRKSFINFRDDYHNKQKCSKLMANLLEIIDALNAMQTAAYFSQYRDFVKDFVKLYKCLLNLETIQTKIGPRSEISS